MHGLLCAFRNYVGSTLHLAGHQSIVNHTLPSQEEIGGLFFCIRSRVQFLHQLKYQMTYVAPKEQIIFIEGKTVKFHYVPIIETPKLLASEDDVYSAIVRKHSGASSLISSFKNGSAFKGS